MFQFAEDNHLYRGVDHFAHNAPPAQFHMDMNAHVQHVIRRHIITLYKNHLGMFEQLAEEHDESMSKFHDALPPQYQPFVNLADHYTEEKSDRIRRAVLDSGNDCLRAINEELDKYNLTLR